LGNQKDHRFFSHYHVRRLPAEVFLDAVSQSTGVPDKFEGYPLGIRAVQVPDPAVKSEFLALFGRSERITACACERNSEVNLPQILHLHGGSTIVTKIKSRDGRLARLVATVMNDKQLTEELFLLTLSRLPRQQELNTVDDFLQQQREQNVSREASFQEILWVLLNTKEFAFQH
jgi:hypothetical protein